MINKTVSASLQLDESIDKLIDSFPKPTTEIQVDFAGLHGEAMCIMREKGWQMVTDTLTHTSKVNGDKTTVEVTCQIELYKNGEKQSKEVWDAELLEVWSELNK